MAELKISPKVMSIYNALQKIEDDLLEDLVALIEDILKERRDIEWEKTNDESNY